MDGGWRSFWEMGNCRQLGQQTADELRVLLLVAFLYMYTRGKKLSKYVLFTNGNRGITNKYHDDPSPIIH